MKIVIDADNQKILEYFNESDTEKIVAKYEAIGKWEDISVDINGDICLWEDL